MYDVRPLTPAQDHYVDELWLLDGDIGLERCDIEEGIFIARLDW